MPQKFVNNARSALVSSISETDTSLAVLPVDADMFPVANVGSASLPSSGDWFKLSLTNLIDPLNPPAEVFNEIVAVRTRPAGSGVMSNVIRAYETNGAGTQRNWPVGTVVRLALTSQDVEQSFALGAQAIAAAQEANAKTWNTVPVLSASTGRAITRADGGKTIPVTGTVTIPANVMIKDDIVVVYNDSAANISIVRASGVVAWWFNGVNADRTLLPRGLATIYCVRNNEFVISGQGVI